MEVTLTLPDDISDALQGRWGDVPKHALEAVAVEGYRSGALTESQVRRLLDLESRFDVHALLKRHRVPLTYSEEDVRDDLDLDRKLDRPGDP